MRHPGDLLQALERQLYQDKGEMVTLRKSTLREIVGTIRVLRLERKLALTGRMGKGVRVQERVESRIVHVKSFRKEAEKLAA